MRPEAADKTARLVREARLEAVARSFVRDKPAPACGVLVSCSDDASATGVVVRALSDAAEQLSLRHMTVGRGASSTQPPQLWTVDAGGVTEDWLDRLDPPRGRSVDLLLWWSDQGRRPFVRESYLLGMMSWSLRPRKTLVLFDGEPGEREALREVLEPLAMDGLEVLGVPAAGSLVPTLTQVLSSVLSSGSHGPRSR